MQRRISASGETGTEWGRECHRKEKVEKKEQEEIYNKEYKGIVFGETKHAVLCAPGGLPWNSRLCRT